MNDQSKMNPLLEALKKAAHELSQYTGGYSTEFDSAEDFHQALVDRIKRLEAGDVAVLPELYIWFAPTSDWDDFVGDAAMGEQVFQLLHQVNH